LDWNHTLQRIWTNGFTRAGIALFSLRVTVEGDYQLGKQPFILLARHTSLADTILVSWFLLVRNRIKARYVMKKELLWDPCLDIVGNRLPNCFIDRSTLNNSKEIDRIAMLADSLGPCEGVVMYPEGTRFSEKKRAQALQRLHRQGAEDFLLNAECLRHVLPPRLTGTMTLLEKAPNADVVFFAHTGFEGASSFADIFHGTMIGREIRFRYWAIPACEIPREVEAQKRWI
jgi:1-acyl-sn-glycerol-3-phosphate acyltransferase